MYDPIYYARAIHFAATILATGIVFFAVFVAGPALRDSAIDPRLAEKLRSRLAVIGGTALVFCVISGAGWLVLTAASMSGQPVAEVFSQDVLGIVLLRTDFGNDWIVRSALACALAALLAPVLSARGGKWAALRIAAVIVAAALVGSLAWAGHGIGDTGIAGLIHPAADVLHLVAAAAWVGGLVPLGLLLTMARTDEPALAAARAATLRFSTLGIVAVATLLCTGTVNTWYLVGSIAALTESQYGHLLLIKLALFAAMVAIAAINWSRLTPKLVQDADPAAAQQARRQLRRNAALEESHGAAVIAVVAVLGTLAPASHAHHQEIEENIPADASFQHIHSEDGMADVMIEPGRVGTARATIHLLDDNLETLAAQQVTLTLVAPSGAGKPIMRAALQEPDGQWHVDGLSLAARGNWMVTINALLASNKRLELAAPIVIDAK